MQRDSRNHFMSGFVRMLPLWTGAIPTGIAYALAARDIGLSAMQTQVMSLTVFSAATQINAIALIADQTSPLLLMIIAVLLNAQLLLLGVAAGRSGRLSLAQRLGLAWFLTDGAYGIAAARGALRPATLLGAGVSMYAGWNLGTATGLLAGGLLGDLQSLNIAMAVPLAFLAVLLPMLRDRPRAGAALVGGVTAALLMPVLPSGIAVLLAGLLGSGSGVWLAGQRSTQSPVVGGGS